MRISDWSSDVCSSDLIKPVKHGLPEKAQTALEDRGLDKTTVNKYKVTVGSESQTFEAIFPRFDNDNNHIANQVRFPDKEFSCEGKINDATLFRSEEHTSELQSLMRISYAVFCLKKKTQH